MPLLGIYLLPVLVDGQKRIEVRNQNDFAAYNDVLKASGQSEDVVDRTVLDRTTYDANCVSYNKDVPYNSIIGIEDISWIFWNCEFILYPNTNKQVIIPTNLLVIDEDNTAAFDKKIDRIKEFLGIQKA